VLRKKFARKTDVGLGTMVGASLTLLAFLLTVTVGFGANLNSARRKLVVEEANAIGTIYLRAGYLREP
jgi:hypothetical protein